MFPGTIVFEEDVSDFITGRREHPRIDVLHISAPCQFWSPARVNAGQHDEANRAALYSIPALVDKVRPRVFLMEQTFGLVSDEYSKYFNMLLHSITALGCSIQWSNRCKFVNYGLPQERKRLMMMGCAPGEPMPAWPSPTHGDGYGLRPILTEAQAIDRLSRRDPLHDLNAAPLRDLPERPSNVAFPKTIVCSGAQKAAHYSGQRDFTLRGKF